MRRLLTILLCICPALGAASIASGQQDSVRTKPAAPCTAPPTIVGCLSSLTDLGCNPKSLPACRGAITASDCRVSVAVKCTPGSVTGSGCRKTQGFTYSATGTGGTSSCTETYTWTVDTQPPVIRLASPATLPCNPTPEQIKAAFGAATVTDNCNQGLVATDSMGEEQGAGCVRTVTRTWTASDSCGNRQTATQTVTFKRDTEQPVITLAAAKDLPCNPTSAQIAAAFGAATVTDSCGGKLAAAGTVGPEQGTGRERSITKSWTVTDPCGNTVAASQTVTFQRDTEKPVITLTSASVVEPACNPTAEQVAAAFGAASVSDNFSTNLVATGTLGTETISSGISYSLTKTWTVRDSCGNTATAMQTVRFKRDTLQPVITCPADVRVNGLGKPRATATLGTATATDNGGSAKLTNDAPRNPSGSIAPFPVGTTIVTWTATDGCGNTSTCRQKVTVLGLIKAIAFFDANGNGNQDLPVATTGESGVPNVKIGLSNGVSSADGSGAAAFNVMPGTYTVRVTVPSGWINTTETFARITIDSTSYNVTATLGLIFLCRPSNGLTPGFWSGVNGANVLNANPGWVTLLNGLTCLRNADGTLHTFTTVADLATWLLGATPINMAYLLSVHLATNVLNSNYNGLGGTVFVPGGVKIRSSDVCIVLFVGVPQPDVGTCASPLLTLATTSTPSTCGCPPAYDGQVSIGDLQLKAACLLAAYGTTVAASKQRTYQECVKAILEMIDHNGDAPRSNTYPCGGVKVPNSTGTCPSPVAPAVKVGG